jgi:mRNA interferase MazF
MTEPLRGDVWLVSLDPTKGREQAGTRPGLIVSDDGFNRGFADLVILIPITSRARGIRSHVELTPPEGGLNVSSFAMCEAVRSVSKARLVKRMGVVSAETLKMVEDRLRILLGL